MCWQPLLLLLLWYDAQATVPHRWSRGELLSIYLSDARHSFLNTIKNLGEGGMKGGRKLEAPRLPLLSAVCLLTWEKVLEGEGR